MEINLFDTIKANEIEIRTTTALMYEIYGREEWIKCIVFMLAQGLHKDKIQWILRSKHMRWASDYGLESETAAETFCRYYSADINAVQGGTLR